jgi:hypothetical protein
MKWIFSILLLLVSSISFGQGFTYSYVDPCSKKLKVINIPNANSTVTVNYLGYVNTFTKDDFDNGNFAGWVGDLSTKYASAPCDEVKTKTQVSQNTIITQNIISTLSSVTAVSTMTVASSVGNITSGGIGNSVDNSSSGEGSGKSSGKSSGKNGKNDKNNTQSGTNTTENGGNNTQSGTNTGNVGQNNPNSGSNSPKNDPQTPQNEPQTGNNPQTPQTGENTGNPGSNTGNSGQNSGGNTGNSGQNGENTGNSGGNTGNSGGNGGNSGGSGGGNGTAEPKSDPTTTPTDNKSGGNGGTTNSVANAAESSSSGGSSGGKPSSKTTAKTGSIIGTGDIVAIRSAEDNSNQFRATMSMTKSNTDNSRAKGALLNFTTTVNNSNLTFYAALTNKKKTNTAIFANSSMIDFERNFFNTTTALESHRFGKLSLMGGANFTAGGLDGEMFTNLSAVGGGFYMFKVGKKVNANILMLAVYSPFTKFYEGRWWNSGVLLVPFSSWDYGISKNFKFNVSFSGTYQYSDKFLNYQILTGGKIML